MNKFTFFFIITFIIVGTALAQTASQVQLLKDRINKNNVVIATDLLQISRSSSDSEILLKQTEIANLNSEIQVAQEFLKQIEEQSIAQPEIISEPIYNPYGVSN